MKEEINNIYQKLAELRVDLYKGFKAPEPEDLIATIENAIDSVEDIQDMLVDLEISE